MDAAAHSLNAAHDDGRDNDPGERPAKRTRRACDPCRRKKSKCSGERPSCALCDKLRVRCAYSLPSLDIATLSELGGGPLPAPESVSVPVPGPVNNDILRPPWLDRIESLEKMLADVVTSLRQGPSSALPTPSFHQTPTTSQAQVGTPDDDDEDHANNVMGEGRGEHDTFQAETLAMVYLVYCDAQPLPLFRRHDFVSTFAHRDRGVVSAVSAVASRFMGRTPEGARVAGRGNNSGRIPSQDEARRHRRAASKHVMARVGAAEGIELADLQTLCLLALGDLHNGDMAQLRMHASLATSLAHGAHLGRGSTEEMGGRGGVGVGSRVAEERRRCYWSIIILQRLTGNLYGAMQLSSSSPASNPRARPQMPPSADTPSVLASPEDVSGGHGHSQQTDDPEHPSGILHVVAELSDVWAQTQVYVQERGGSSQNGGSSPPPWSSESSYSKALEAIMSLGSRISTAHRYRFKRLSSVGPRELHDARDYWGPWLLTRLLYHTSICILNHPILVMLQLQHMLRGARNVPELFLQQTSHHRDHHAAWIMHFIDFITSRQYIVSDPLFAYCAAVLATIELHQSFTSTSTAAPSSTSDPSRRRLGYDKCLSFILTLSDTWPFLGLVVRRLESLRESVESSYRPNPDPTAPAGDMRIDVSSFFAVLDITRTYSTDHTTGTSGSLFGSTLAPRPMAVDPSLQTQHVGAETDLPRLPGVTQIEDTSGNGSDFQQAQHLQMGGQMPMPQQYDEGNMLFPADQIFSGLFSPHMNPWDMGEAVGGFDEAEALLLLGQGQG